MPRSRFTRAALGTLATLAALVGAACGETPRASTTPQPERTVVAAPVRSVEPMQDTPPPVRLLAIDWAKVPLVTVDDALAVWRTIAPTGEDWQEKLDEVPATAARPLAIALLLGGSFTCMAPQLRRECTQPHYDVDPPAHAATFDAPCLRRLLALWALDHLEPADVPTVLPALRSLVAIPPPESQLVEAAIAAVPEYDRATRLELVGLALAAGQSDAVDMILTTLDEPSLVTAATRFHSASALVVLSADSQRPTYIAAVTDEALSKSARIGAIADLLTIDVANARLEPDLHAALVTATASADCGVAAVAIRALVATGEKQYLPKRGKTVLAMMRTLCVIASYERLQGADDPSLLAGLVPAKGLERLAVTYDALGETDEDGDGNVHTSRQLDLLSRDALAFPQTDEATRAMQSCEGTVCKSADLEVRYVIKPGAGGLRLTRIELWDRPPCPAAPVPMP